MDSVLDVVLRNEIMLTAILSGVTGLIGWILGKRTRIAKTKGLELGNIEKAVDIWRHLAEGYVERLQTIQTDIIKQSDENMSLRCSVEALKIENVQLKSEIANLRKLIESLKLDNEKLTKQFNIIKNNKGL